MANCCLRNPASLIQNDEASRASSAVSAEAAMRTPDACGSLT